MSEPNSAGSHLETDESEELQEYRPINSLAVIGLIAGLFSVVAFYHPVLWGVPVLGAALSAWALKRLANSDVPQLGRRAALAGLTLSLALGASAVTRMAIFQWEMHVETRSLARQWFEALRDHDPYQAHQLTRNAGSRFKPDDDLVVRYSEPEHRRNLEEYVAEPPVRLLLSLGKYAQVRYFANHTTDATSEQPVVSDIYAVSVRHEGQTTSCFVQLYWTRSLEFGTNHWSWRLSSAKVLTQPPEGWNAAG